jgi:DNA-binding response OmpR family regulator
MWPLIDHQPERHDGGRTITRERNPMRPATELTILACDDDPDILEALRIYLSGEGYPVLTASDGATAVQLVAQRDVHLVLLDVMMPEMDGITAAARIRQHSNVPIIFLSAKGEEADRVLGLHAGADDYIVKPFSPGELFARIRSALRRYTQLGGLAPVSDVSWRTGGLEVDDERKSVRVDGEEVSLTALEYGILRLMIASPDRVYSSAQIYEVVWGAPAFDAGRTVAVHIRHIREKIETDPRNPRYLKVVYGLGYKVVRLP